MITRPGDQPRLTELFERVVKLNLPPCACLRVRRAGEDGEFIALLTDVIRVDREIAAPFLPSED